VLIGVYGANMYSPGGQATFPTEDADLFLPLDSANLMNAWDACEDCGLALWMGDEPLEQPRDAWLADRVVERRLVTRGTRSGELHIDLTLEMKGYAFDAVWAERTVFVIEGHEIAVARLEHIIRSKHASGREKDRLFLATHRDALKQLLRGQGE
jgi:hypothetical protein